MGHFLMMVKAADLGESMGATEIIKSQSDFLSTGGKWTRDIIWRNKNNNIAL